MKRHRVRLPPGVGAPLGVYSLTKQKRIVEKQLALLFRRRQWEMVDAVLGHTAYEPESPADAVALQYVAAQLTEGQLEDGGVTSRPGEPRSPEEVERLVLDALYRATDLPRQCAIVIPDLSIVDRECLAFLAKHPDYIHDLHWRVFEQMLEAVFRSLGYETELGPGRGDEGVDLRLIQKAPLGTFLILVQAKHYAQSRPVTLEAVQALYSVVEIERANKGIVATTSRFLPVAKRFAKRCGHRLLLAGPNEIVDWLRAATKQP